MKRHRKTIKFLRKHIPEGSSIIDLGNPSELSTEMKEYYTIANTHLEDLDIFSIGAWNRKYLYTSFQVFEHLFAPFNFLNAASGQLVCSVPLKLWFAKAYWNDNDKRDCHYHEFEKKQFDALLDRTGWKIQDSELWTCHERIPFGIRPLLRFFYNRHYIVYATKEK